MNILLPTPDPNTGPLRPSAEQAITEWTRRVDAAHAQAERLGSVSGGPDAFGARAAEFRDNPRRSGDDTLDVILSLARANETWLDIGPGGGRYALPLALHTRRIIALDPSPRMLEALRSSAEEHAIERIEIVQGRWPAEQTYEVDVALICNLGYGIADIEPFLIAMEAAASRLCVAMMRWDHPTGSLDWLWPEVFDEPRATLPALRELVALLLARGRKLDLRMVPIAPPSYPSFERACARARMHMRIAEDTPAAERLDRALRARLEPHGGRWSLDAEQSWVGIVSWAPER